MKKKQNKLCSDSCQPVQILVLKGLQSPLTKVLYSRAVQFPAQRGLIYAKDKHLGRLCKICNPFFHEFQVVPSAKGFKLVCYTATLFTTEARDQRIDPDRRLAYLSRRRGAADNQNLHSSHGHHSMIPAWHVRPVLQCSLRHFYAVKSEY